MMRRLLPHPYLSIMLVAIWLMLVNDFRYGSLVFGIILAVVIPVLTAPYWPARPVVKSPLRIVTYLLVVMWDIVVANVQVAMIVLFKPVSQLRPAWICVPLELEQPEAIAMLAGTITLTPGTVSCDLAEDGRSLLVHCLHAVEPAQIVDDIKTRYESRLKEIFV